MKILVIILLFVIAPLTIFAQEFWTEQASGIFTPLTSSSACSNTSGWICGFNGKVLRTTNGGTGWLDVSGGVIPASCQLTNIFAVSDLTAITNGNQGSTSLVFVTTNGGTSWTLVFQEAGGYIEAVWMKDAQNGFMQGDAVTNRWSLWKTTNGGFGWDSTGLYLSNTFTNEYGWNNSFYLNNNSIWFGTTNFKIYYSSNYGASWTSQPSGNITIFSICMMPPSYTTGFGCGPEIVKTTNSGTTWSMLTTPGSGFYGGISASTTSIYYVHGSNVYVSSNAGSTWTVQYSAPSGNFRHISERSVNGNTFTTAWAVRDNGGISKWSISVGVKQISSSIPNTYMLYQNYPNPFNPSTKIKFDVTSPPTPLHMEKGVKLLIYDISGREVTTLVNESLQPGTYETEWNASNVASGVYFYKLSAGNYSETKRLVLLK